MAFNRENLSIVVNNAKSGTVPSQWLYYNDGDDTVTAAGFFADGSLEEGDQIDCLSDDYTTLTRYRVSEVSGGAATVLASATSTYNVGGVSTRTGAGAVDITNEVTLLVTTGTDALTLADGVEGQRKIIKMKTDGGDGTLTPANLADGSTITFDAVGETAELIFADSEWQIVALIGATLSA
jgi:hypothetical protein